MVETTKLLWVSDGPIPENVQLATADWQVVGCPIGEPLPGKFDQADLAMVYPNGTSEDPDRLAKLLGLLSRTSRPAIFLLSPDAIAARELIARHSEQVVILNDNATTSELAAALATAATFRPIIGELESSLRVARKIAADPEEDIDEEMRLAARLQRDFLPRRLPEVGPVRFSVYYRPFSWVSGDIYDVARLDETHLGFYVADAIGHGMPAALLTMFIKKALQTKRITGNSYQIIPPDEALAELNADICEQNLSSCQFCTAVYFLINIASMKLTYARAGHPDAILLHANGQAERLTCPGSLLGIFPEEQFEARERILQPGDRLMLYTDGVENAFQQSEDDPPLEQVIGQWRSASREQMLLEIVERIDETADPARDDDVTIMVMDVDP